MLVGTQFLQRCNSMSIQFFLQHCNLDYIMRLLVFSFFCKLKVGNIKSALSRNSLENGKRSRFGEYNKKKESHTLKWVYRKKGEKKEELTTECSKRKEKKNYDDEDEKKTAQINAHKQHIYSKPV